MSASVHFTSEAYLILNFPVKTKTEFSNEDQELKHIIIVPSTSKWHANKWVGCPHEAVAITHISCMSEELWTLRIICKAQLKRYVKKKTHNGFFRIIHNNILSMRISGSFARKNDERQFFMSTTNIILNTLFHPFRLDLKGPGINKSCLLRCRALRHRIYFYCIHSRICCRGP